MLHPRPSRAAHCPPILGSVKPRLAAALPEWERVYNFDRFSMALRGLTPAEKLATRLTAETAA